MTTKYTRSYYHDGRSVSFYTTGRYPRQDLWNLVKNRAMAHFAEVSKPNPHVAVSTRSSKDGFTVMVTFSCFGEPTVNVGSRGTTFARAWNALELDLAKLPGISMDKYTHLVPGSPLYERFRLLALEGANPARQ